MLANHTSFGIGNVTITEMFSLDFEPTELQMNTFQPGLEILGMLFVKYFCKVLYI